MTLRFTNIFVQQLRAFDVEEERSPFRTSLHLGNLLGQRVGYRLRDQRLSTSRRTVEKDSLGWSELMLAKQICMQIGQFNRIADLINLRGQSPDIRIVNIRYLFKNQLFDLGLGNTFEYVLGFRLEQQGVPCTKGTREQGCGEPNNPLFIGVTNDQRPLTVLEDLLEHHDFPVALELAHRDHIQRLVENNLLTRPQQRHIDLRAGNHTHLAATCEHIHRPIIEELEEHPVSTRRLSKAVHLSFEHHDLVTCLTKGADQTLILSSG